MASLIKSPYFSPMWQKSGLGTRTKSVGPFECEKRVGFNQVS